MRENRKYSKGQYVTQAFDPITKNRELLHLPKKTIIIKVINIDIKKKLRIKQEGFVLGPGESFSPHYKTREPENDRLFLDISLIIFDYEDELQITRDNFLLLTKDKDNLMPIEWTGIDATNPIGLLLGFKEKGTTIILKEKIEINLIYDIPKEDDYRESELLLANKVLGKLGTLASAQPLHIN